MSDLLAPFILIFRQESEIFYNFLSLFRRKQFICYPNDQSMDVCIARARELLRILLPHSHTLLMQSNKHLEQNSARRIEDTCELLFIHRWMLLCFRREFVEIDALRIWQCCWSEVETSKFQYFVCIAILQLYGDQIIKSTQNSDELLFHFACLSKHMDVDMVLKKV